MAVKKVVLIRHGESLWNQENRFTGWTDVDLSPKGVLEAQQAGILLKNQGFQFDYAFTSVLKRAIRTLWFILDELDLLWIPVEKSWRLNERHYGSLQGLDKKDTVQQFGAEQVQQWRRGFAISPPPLEHDDARFPGNDPRYVMLAKEELPTTESLATTVKRVVPYWQQIILPRLQRGDRLIIAAHGNSLRALVQHLDKLTEEEVLDLNIPTGIPLIYSFNEMMEPLEHHYLGDQGAIEAKIKAVANQGK